jgi:NAD(P)H-nitrite reductase large subunit
VEARIFQEYLTGLGIEILSCTSPLKIWGSGKVEGIETTDGRRIPCGLVIAAKGVTANKDLLKGADIQAKDGILIDEHCRTSIDDVYAAGDVSQSFDAVRNEKWVNALWPLAVEGGRVAAENILGKKSILDNRTSMNSLVIGNCALISCGLTGFRDKVVDGEEIVHRGPGLMDYKRFLLKDHRLVGYSLVGDVRHAGVLTSLVRSGISSPHRLRSLLVSGRYDLASMLPLIQENPEKFHEPEYEEVLSFC